MLELVQAGTVKKLSELEAERGAHEEQQQRQAGERAEQATVEEAELEIVKMAKEHLAEENAYLKKNEHELDQQIEDLRQP